MVHWGLLYAVMCCHFQVSKPLNSRLLKLKEDIQRNYLSVFAQFLYSGPGHLVLVTARGRTRWADGLRAVLLLCWDSPSQAGTAGHQRSHCSFSSFWARSMENPVKNMDDPPLPCYIYIYVQLKMFSSKSPIPQLNTEDQQGGRGATTSPSGSLPYDNSSLLKDNLLFFQGNTL